MLPWSEAIDPVADQNGFAGVVSVHRGGETGFARAYGLADRANELPNTVRTRFAIASGTKGLTALAVVSLVSDGALAMSTTARSVLGADLPLIGDDVTVEHPPARAGQRGGGIYSTAADVSALWQSLFAGRMVPDRWVTEMVRPRSDVPAESMRYGLGFWLGQHSDTVIVEGYDTGVSFRSVHDPGSALTWTVISNSSDGAWR